MATYPLTVTHILRHGARFHGDRAIVTWDGTHATRQTFADTTVRIERLANALSSLGVGHGDVVGTFCWNHQAHVEAYFAVPCMGAVLHTLNIRLFPDQLGHVIRDGGDRVLIVDDDLLPVLARVPDALVGVEHVIVVGPGDAAVLQREVLRYDELLDEAETGYPWPALDETSPAAMCHTSGTTGLPRGVVYSHRSQWAHTFGTIAGGHHVRPGDRTLLVVPQFHANAWGLVHISWVMGADLLQPGPHLQPRSLVEFIEAERPTYSAGVPTVWSGVLDEARRSGADLSCLSRIVIGGSAVPRSLIEAFDAHGVEVVQGWGMTEMSPLGAVAIPPPDVHDPEERLALRCRAGQVLAGVDVRLVADDGTEQPWDARSRGEVQVRGPWITGSYHGLDVPDSFDDGWLRTGDIGTLDERGFLSIVDRSKDIIKSGGEWVSSVDLENAIMDHPDVVEASVVGVPDERWDERPFAIVVLAAGAGSTPDDLAEFLRGRVARWWVPERWALVDEIPRTSVGKFDKKALREAYAAGRLGVMHAGRGPR